MTHARGSGASRDAVLQCGPGPPQLAPEGFVSLARVHAELRSIPPLPPPSHHASLGRKPQAACISHRSSPSRSVPTVKHAEYQAAFLEQPASADNSPEQQHLAEL